MVRTISVSTAFTKQSNKDMHFLIATLRPNHQTGWLPQGWTDTRAYPSYNWKSRFDPRSANCSVPNASASFLPNHTRRSIFSGAVDRALKASHLCLSLGSFSSPYTNALAFTGNETVLKKEKTLSMRPLNNTQMDLLQSVSVLQHPNEHLGDKPQKILDPAQFLSDRPFVHH